MFIKIVILALLVSSVSACTSVPRKEASDDDYLERRAFMHLGRERV